MDEFSSQLNIVSSCEAHHENPTHSDSVMTSDDRVIYNMLRRSAAGKPTYASFGLEQAEKTAILRKTGPCPKWYTPWRKREFTLKGNFLYYYKVKSKKTGNNRVRGAIYIRGAAINEEKVKGSKYLIRSS
ncbi:uncharacterized protein [Dysidea avara]|uniref:uncharacterized protein n=1 Tax=Dysidea avara TaxID=196820 RepID=UPI00331E68CF